MNSYDKLYPCISKVLTYKQLNVPRIKEYTFRNYICFDVFVTLPNKKNYGKNGWFIFRICR